MAGRRPLVVISLLGTSVDRAPANARWDRWRPTISLVQHADKVVDRLELLYPPAYADLAATVAADVRAVSPETTVVLHEIHIEDPWALDEVYEALYAFADRYTFAPDDEDYLVHITTGTHIAQICLFLLTETRHIPARLVQTSPPNRTVRAPGGFTVMDLDLAAYDRIASRFHQEREHGVSFLKDGIATRNVAFNRTIDSIERVALRSTDPILLMGPTGSGKSQLARRIFELKQARAHLKGAFVEVNCATIRGDAALSMLFGHVRGAFTGAAADRAGMLRQADGGMLFLDEIGELGLEEQAMLLRAIEHGVFQPMGSDRDVRSRFQLLAGTNRDLRTEVLEGRFRGDLLARIQIWSFDLPSLAERREDIAPNLDFELARCTRDLKRRITMTREARTQFLAFGESPGALWRANFRDFAAAVRRMATLANAGRITSTDVDEEIERLMGSWRATPDPERAKLARTEIGNKANPQSDVLAAVIGATAAQEIDPFDRVQLEYVLDVCSRSASLSEAGRQLFAASRIRKTSSNDADRLRKYLARFGIEFKVVGNPRAEERATHD